MIKDVSKKVRSYPNLNQDMLCLQIGALIYKNFCFSYHVNLAIPPFRKQFSLEEDAYTKQVANAQSGIDRVIGRIKDFDILTCELPSGMFDLFDHMAVEISALVNLQEPIIPLHCQ